MIINLELISKVFLVTVFKLSLFVQHVKSLGCPLCISIWDPFCKEDILYIPYVRVFQKGRPGALLRDRGPGFIDVTGMQDIYVCTNGLVMLYYMKTRGMGEVYEHGELHWAPHHCEMYNPSCNNGQPGDFPKKTLLSILLIGHPKDYRKPALQMFIAPMFDPVYGDYINVTSLIMVGSDGECLIEKGVERARLRVRNKEPKMRNYTFERPSVFCQLDAQRKLGQKGTITLNSPGNVSPDPRNTTLFTLPVKDLNSSFINSPYERPSKHTPSETGPAIYPRFSASQSGLFKEDEMFLAYAADEVYAALINDRKMRFVGCLSYPDFSEEQYRIIYTRYQESNYSKELNLTSYGEILESADFWQDEVHPPWPLPVDPTADSQDDKDKDKKKRFEMYQMKDISSEGYPLWEEAKAPLDAAMEELKTAKANKDNTTKEKEMNVTQQQMILSLWPLKKGYEGVAKYLIQVKTEIETVWQKILEVAGGLSEGDASTPKPIQFEDAYNEDNKAHQLAQWKLDLLKNVSHTKYERRFEPYNRQLVDEYNNYTIINRNITDLLRKKSVELGPMISNAETLQSRYRIFLNLFKKAATDLKNAVKKMEKTGRPYDGFSGKHPMDSFFMDTMIEISDTGNATDMTNWAETKNGEDPKMIQGGSLPFHSFPGKACYELPFRKKVCRDIRPHTDRASQLLKNRQGKGLEWTPEDSWRQKVLDLIEQIFMKVCPYISNDFADGVNRIVKGYLLGNPLGTGLKEPIIGTRLYYNDHSYQAIVYNMTYNETHVNGTEGHFGKLRAMDPFWDQITTALDDCNSRAKPMQFWHAEEGDKPVVITYRKYFPNNGTEQFYDVDDLMMQEKADFEYAFNWALDMQWRIFSTVMGICMPAYEKKIPLITARFYALYSNDFLHPLRQIWMSNRDNAIHKVILGNYYGRGKADKWAKVCMESSFVESGDRNYRPPRHLYVNAFTEMNYFVTGPMAGTSGILSVASGI